MRISLRLRNVRNLADFENRKFDRTGPGRTRLLQLPVQYSDRLFSLAFVRIDQVDPGTAQLPKADMYLYLNTDQQRKKP